MKIILIVTILIASTSLIGINVEKAGIAEGVYFAKVGIFGVGEKECLIVRKGKECSEYAADGICCVESKDKKD